MTISQEMLKICILDMSLEISNFILGPHLPGANTPSKHHVMICTGNIFMIQMFSLQKITVDHGRDNLTHWPLGDMRVILQVYFWNSFYEMISWALPVKIVSGGCHRTPLMISGNGLRWWLGPVRREVFTWANAGPDLCYHIDRLVQERRNSIANALELPLSCNNPS